MGKKLIWIDLEMTGLESEKYVIIEIATMITDNNLKPVAEGPNIAINYPEDILTGMEAWSQNQHEKSGLLDRARNSKINCREAEKKTIQFLSSYCKKKESPMCGNSIWQDRRFLLKYMPELEDFFHYRMIDVSTIKELATRWHPNIPPYEKEKDHLALADIRESINELKYYRDKLFL